MPVIEIISKPVEPIELRVKQREIIEVVVRGRPGIDGADGQDGTDGEDGSPGLSAYQIAVNQGFSGTESDWLASLQGPPGNDGEDGLPGAPGTDGTDGEDGSPGLSAYQVAVNNGFVGTESDWLASLQGEPGPQNLFIQETEPPVTGEPFLWVDTSGGDVSLWFNDGT